MPARLDEVPEELRYRLVKRKQPEWIAPMLASLTEDYFSSPDWIFERKLDGERCLAFVRGDRVRLYSRNRIELSPNYPELAEALPKLAISSDFVVDGEVVAFDGDRDSFTLLQSRIQTRDPEKARRSGVKIHYCVFDLLHLDSYDVRQLPTVVRKKLLRKVLRFRDPVRSTTHRAGQGEAYREEACSKGWEGVIAKRAAATYTSGRAKDWLKFKCVRNQELVIVGFTAPEGRREGFRSLLLGYYDGGALRYAGKVSAGGTHALIRELGAELRKIERRQAPVADRVREKEAHWVEPVFVGEVAFTEWTRDGKLRHPRFKGLRRDKKARDVVRES